ncbi:hypothetical protein GGX14DRAFT_172834 [Mycena pura]|uniref:Uncharacterized protein n=1 Tax=Mycena pura TaxID=153505 RepID=A0AAD6V1F2_9AGAR|nr:hypothetical protein GGX14DRAFT_172834 [Mycena pura]
MNYTELYEITVNYRITNFTSPLRFFTYDYPALPFLKIYLALMTAYHGLSVDYHSLSLLYFQFTLLFSARHTGRYMEKMYINKRR